MARPKLGEPTDLGRTQTRETTEAVGKGSGEAVWFLGDSRARERPGGIYLAFLRERGLTR
jgi:hypothetical protein